MRIFLTKRCDQCHAGISDRGGDVALGNHAKFSLPQAEPAGRFAAMTTADAPKPTTYWDYIKVEQLLSLQDGLGDSELTNDEVMFIVVHQIDELWMKLILREIVSVRDLFAQPRVPEQSLASAVRGIRRMALLFKKLADHFEVMETLTTRSYLSFRGKLYPASGFQSAQLREIEILMGLEPSQRIPLGHEESYLRALKYSDGSTSPAYERVEARTKDLPSLKTAVSDWLYRTPIEGSTPDDPRDQEHVKTFIEDFLVRSDSVTRSLQGYAQRFALTEADVDRLSRRYDDEIAKTRSFLMGEDLPEAERGRARRIRAALVFIESYRELPLLAWPREVVDSIIELEQAIVMFRQRHARAVERIIGRRTGTGGSAGVDYLDKTASYRVFSELWATRTILLQREALPEVHNAEAYTLTPGD